MHILLVNDDGFDSPPLSLLCRAAADRGHRVTVAAPDTQQSAKSHSFTVFKPLMVYEDRMEGAEKAWRVDGSPVDCTRLGLQGLTEDRPDAVLSGINNGWNIGLATYVSGTVGAAREAAFDHYPAVAVSMEPGTPEDTARWFADYAVRAAEKLTRWRGPELAVCNLNAPKVPLSEVRGTKVVPLSTIVYRDGYERRVSPRGVQYFWLKPEDVNLHPEPGSDLAMLYDGWATVTFLAPAPCGQEAYADFPPPLHEN